MVSDALYQDHPAVQLHSIQFCSFTCFGSIILRAVGRLIAEIGGPSLLHAKTYVPALALALLCRADAWLITPSGVGDGIASGAFMDLSQLVLFDQRLQWQGLINQMRSVGLVYGSKVGSQKTVMLCRLHTPSWRKTACVRACIRACSLQVIALPLSAYSFQLFYRMDTFQANNWTVPVTWRGLAGMAERINGTNDMYGFCGLWGPCGNLGINLFK